MPGIDSEFKSKQIRSKEWKSDWNPIRRKVNGRTPSNFMLIYLNTQTSIGTLATILPSYTSFTSCSTGLDENKTCLSNKPNTIQNRTKPEEVCFTVWKVKLAVFGLNAILKCVGVSVFVVVLSNFVCLFYCLFFSTENAIIAATMLCYFY